MVFTPKYKSLNLRNDLMEFNRYADENFQIDRYNDYFDEFSNYTLPAHWHNEFEIDIVINESVTYYVNSKPYLLNKGDTILINSKRTHYAIGNNAQSKAVGFIFNPESILGNINSTVYQKYFFSVIQSNVDAIVLSSPHFHNVWQWVYDVYQLDETNTYYEMNCLESIVRIWRFFFEKFESVKDSSLTLDMHSKLLVEMINYLQKHYSEKITIDTLSSQIGISQSSCFRIFKQYTSASPISYLNDYRLRLAAFQVRTTSKSITEIAMDCGFESSSYFTVLFKRKFGTSPLKYKNSC